MAKRIDQLLLDHIRDAGLPEPVPEHQFHPERKWRFDYAWPGYKVAAEVEGGTWAHGRHTRGRGFENDARKYNQAAVHGWLVLRFTGDMIRKGEAVETISQAIKALNVGEAA